MTSTSSPDLPAIVVDPSLPPGRLRLARAAGAAWQALDRRADEAGLTTAVDRLLTLYFLIAAGAVAAQVAASGVHWAWAWFTVCASAAAFLAAVGLRCGARLYQGRYVLPADLDPDSRRLLARAQHAIGAALAAGVRREGFLDQAATAAVLAAREWDIAIRLSRACALADEHARVRASAPPGAAASRQQAVLREVAGAAARQVEELEEYAAQVSAADAAYRSWAAEASLAELDERFRWLLAGTAADAHGHADLGGLRAEAAAAEQAFRAS